MKHKNIQPRLRGRYASKKPRQIILTFMALASISAISYLFRYEPLLSPCDPQGCHADPIVIANPVMAKDEIRIVCDRSPQEYLECQVHNKTITWEDHEKLYRLVNECENKSWNTNATNKNVHKDGSISTDRGIFQVNDKYHPKLTNEMAFNFQHNIDYAIKLYQAQGVKPWTCARILKIK